MTGGRSFDLAVLGAGPAGLMAALAAARNSDVALVADRLPSADDPPRVDAVPARLLALLVDFDIPPQALAVEELHEHRWVAWSAKTPRVRRLPPAAHVERPLLDLALLTRVLRHPRIALFLSKTWARDEGVFWGDGWRTRRLVDATGRAAVTSESVIRLERPWAARTLWRISKRDRRGPPFALAPLPDGYAYRIEAQHRVVVGFVGRGRAVNGSPDELEWWLRSAGGSWVLAELPPLAKFEEGRASAASLQWATSATLPDASRPIRIGDAALARDPLSSQGIAIACSEALFSASVDNETDQRTFEFRQFEQRQSHLAALEKMIAGCLFSTAATWCDYRGFVSQHTLATTAGLAIALRGGKIVNLPSVRQ